MSHAHHAKPIRVQLSIDVAQLASSLRPYMFGTFIAAVALVLVGGAAGYLEHHDYTFAAITVLLAGVPAVTGCVAYWLGGKTVTVEANWDGHTFDPAGRVGLDVSEEDRREIALEVRDERTLDAAGLG